MENTGREHTETMRQLVYDHEPIYHVSITKELHVSKARYPARLPGLTSRHLTLQTQKKIKKKYLLILAPYSKSPFVQALFIRKPGFPVTTDKVNKH